MHSYLISFLAIIICLPQVIKPQPPILPKAAYESNMIENLKNLKFYNYSHSKLNEFVDEQNKIASINKHIREFKLRLAAEREMDIYRRMLASQVKSSIIRDFLTSRYWLNESEQTRLLNEINKNNYFKIFFLFSAPGLEIIA